MERSFNNGLSNKQLWPGNYIDVLSTQNEWCVGVIRENLFAKGQVKIHFDGWGPEQDETIDSASIRLTKFRLHTKAYTGPPTLALRPEMKISNKYFFKQMSNEIQK